MFHIFINNYIYTFFTIHILKKLLKIIGNVIGYRLQTYIYSKTHLANSLSGFCISLILV